MRAKELEKLLKKNTPKQVLQMYMDSKINLYDYQLQKVIDLKNGVKNGKK